MVAHNTGSTVTCSVIKLAYYNLKLYELEIYDLIVAKVALKVYRYRYRHRGKSLFTYRLFTKLKIPLPYISVRNVSEYLYFSFLNSPISFRISYIFNFGFIILLL